LLELLSNTDSLESGDAKFLKDKDIAFAYIFSRFHALRGQRNVQTLYVKLQQK
jgi:hypothetical protein